MFVTRFAVKAGYVERCSFPTSWRESWSNSVLIHLSVSRTVVRFIGSIISLRADRIYPRCSAKKSKELLDWSGGLRELRHGYAQDRMVELTEMVFSRQDRLEIISQELGHFRPEIVLTYLRRCAFSGHSYRTRLRIPISQFSIIRWTLSRLFVNCQPTFAWRQFHPKYQRLVASLHLNDHSVDCRRSAVQHFAHCSCGLTIADG